METVVDKNEDRWTNLDMCVGKPDSRLLTVLPAHANGLWKVHFEIIHMEAGFTLGEIEKRLTAQNLSRPNWPVAPAIMDCLVNFSDHLLALCGPPLYRGGKPRRGLVLHRYPDGGGLYFRDEEYDYLRFPHEAHVIGISSCKHI